MDRESVHGTATC